MSGGGVGATVSVCGGMRAPPTSPTNAVPSLKYATWWEACPGVYSTWKPSTVSPPLRIRRLRSGTGTNSPQSASRPSSPP